MAQQAVERISTMRDCHKHGWTAHEIRVGDGCKAYICLKCREEHLLHELTRD